MSDWLIDAEAESRLGETTEAKAVPELTWLPRLTDHAVSTLPVGIQTNFVTSTTPVALTPMAFCQRLSAFLVAELKFPLTAFS